MNNLLKVVFVMKNNNLDVMLADLLKVNEKKIQAITPKNPSIKKNDEWRKDTHWDSLYKELAIKWMYEKYGLLIFLMKKIIQ